MRYRIYIRFILGLVALVYWGTLALAQKSDLKKAKQLFDKENYALALPLYQELTQSDPDNTFYNFCLGLCYSNSLSEKHRAIQELEKAVTNFEDFENSAPEDAYYALGRAYHVVHRFTEAIETYEIYISYVQKDLEIEVKDLKKRFALDGQGLTEQQFTFKFVSSDPVIQVFKELIGKANEQIKRCNFGRVLMSNPIDVIVESRPEIQ